jgi:hypothetical protein
MNLAKYGNGDVRGPGARGPRERRMASGPPCSGPGVTVFRESH